MNRFEVSNDPDFALRLDLLKTAWHEADAVIIGAGSGLSTAAGFTYAGERFERYFSDFAALTMASHLSVVMSPCQR